MFRRLINVNDITYFKFVAHYILMKKFRNETKWSCVTFLEIKSLCFQDHFETCQSFSSNLVSNSILFLVILHSDHAEIKISNFDTNQRWGSLHYYFYVCNLLEQDSLVKNYKLLQVFMVIEYGLWIDWIKILNIVSNNKQK